MTSVQVGAEGDLLTIRVDLAETARDLAQHAQLEASHQDIQARLQESERQRDEATQVLAALRQAHQELMAVGTAGERRRASRARRADITVELQRPDGTMLFQGPVRDISRTGMGFACEQSVDGAPELLWVTLHPDGQRPIEAIARLAWLRQEDANGSYAGGCELLDVSPGSRVVFEEILNHHSA